MKTFVIKNGTMEDATVIGRVCAMDEQEALDTLRAYKNGFKVTEAGPGVPNAYVEWAHERLEELPAYTFIAWTAHPEQ